MSKKTREIKTETEGIVAGGVVIEQPKVSEVVLEVTGTAPLIQHNFGQKGVEEMLRKHMGISVQKEPKRPREVIEQAKVKNTEGQICMPPVAFKKAMLTASTQIKGLKKTQLRTQLFIVGSSIPIQYRSETARMDIVRLSGMTRVPDVRFRPSFHDWKARLAIQFTDPLQVQSVVDLLNRAGKVGIGEWRPDCDGTFGTFVVSRHIASAAEREEVHKQCSVPLVPLVVPQWALDAEIDPELLRKLFSESATQSEENGLKEDDQKTAETA